MKIREFEKGVEKNTQRKIRFFRFGGAYEVRRYYFDEYTPKHKAIPTEIRTAKDLYDKKSD